MANFEDLLCAFHYVSAGAPSEHEAYFCVPTGKFYFHSDVGDNEEPLPDDIVDSAKYIAIPHKHDLGLGNQLALKFAAQVLPGDLEEVHDIFRRRGAYGRFKGLLTQRGTLEQWRQFEDTSQRQALHEWCAENGIEVEG